MMAKVSQTPGECGSGPTRGEKRALVQGLGVVAKSRHRYGTPPPDPQGSGLSVLWTGGFHLKVVAYLVVGAGGTVVRY